jgi:hypothetical protein
MVTLLLVLYLVTFLVEAVEVVALEAEALEGAQVEAAVDLEDLAAEVLVVVAQEEVGKFLK